MANAQATAEDKWTSGRGLLTLWTAVGLGPIVWAARFTIVYVLAGVACTTGGVVAMAVITVVSVGLTLLGAGMGWSIWQEVGGGPTTAGGIIGRTRFLAISAVVLGLSFTLVILVEAIPIFFIEPCRS